MNPRLRAIDRAGSAASLFRKTLSQRGRFGKPAIAVTLPRARGFLIAGVLRPKLTSTNHIAIGANLT